MKKMRRLIPAFAMLLVAATMLSTASFAWFTMGTYATADGMKVTAESASTLLIIDADLYPTDTDIKNAFGEARNYVTFEGEGNNLQPATLDAATSTLKTLVDATFVDHVTGELTAGATMKDAEETTNYVECIALIAAAGAAMNTANSTLKVTVTAPESIAYLNNAVSIAFWVNGTYVDHTNLLSVMDGTKATIDLGVTSIPQAVVTAEDGATTLSYVTVTMRVYYDGALVDENIVDEGATTANGTTYVRNDKLTTAAAEIDVRFDYTANN